jgi:hypothetical protein
MKSLLHKAVYIFDESAFQRTDLILKKLRDGSGTDARFFPTRGRRTVTVVDITAKDNYKDYEERRSQRTL